MQFNSYIFILVFLPIFLLFYFGLNKLHNKSGHWLIIIAGAIFYYSAGIEACKMLFISIMVNFWLAVMIGKFKKQSRIIFFITIAVNVGILLFYKYIGFIVTATLMDEINPINFKDIVMPLGISFFTFQQIMYVAGIYKGEIERTNLLDYIAYIMYFPKLIMGPIVEPAVLLSQFNDSKLKSINIDNVAIGIKLFSIGLWKKLVLADTFRRGVEWGYGNIGIATATDMILTMLFYTFEIYFDFSGYTDMATGISKMINIDLPMNFDSPYKACSIRDFWKRWHITLTTFFTKYFYYPLGGNKAGRIRTYVNIMIVFLVSGLWHGANITFILWGGIYGILQIIERIFEKYFIKLMKIVQWIYTFIIVNVLWLLFRSESIRQWCVILYKIIRFQSIKISDGMIEALILPETSFILELFHLTKINEGIRGFSILVFILMGFIICLIPENNYKSQDKKSIYNMVLASVAFVWGFLCLSSETVFVYFNF